MRLTRPTSLDFRLLLLPLFLAAQTVCAQLAPPDDFFNNGAQFYISNNIPAALERTESGLKLYPDDEKLQKLEKLLKQQQQKQNQQQQQQKNQQNQKASSQKNSSGQKNQPPQNSQGQKNQNEQPQKSAEQKKEDQQKQAEQQKSAAEKNGEKKDETAEGQPAKPRQMTPQEAKRLLDSQKGDEKLLQLKPPEKPEDHQRPVKDW
ncbi:MAG TPA: hypothetical protein VFC85_06975 [Verrucomicrobiae bacterium]|nr:hypothetical protein [Verrucomicrobiae bacterium]